MIRDCKFGALNDTAPRLAPVCYSKLVPSCAIMPNSRGSNYSKAGEIGIEMLQHLPSALEARGRALGLMMKEVRKAQ